MSDLALPSRGWTEHADIRAHERFGIEATAADWRAAVLSIWNTLAGETPTALFLGVIADGKEAWGLHLGGHDVRVVYDPATACIVTVTDLRRRAIGEKRHQKRTPQFVTGRRRQERGGEIAMDDQD